MQSAIADGVGDAFAQRLEPGVRRLALPVGEIGGLPAAELERQLHAVDRCGDQHVALRGGGGFVLDPLGADRVFRPEDDDALRAFELALDRLIERLARDDLAVPPHRPAAPAERMRRPRGAVAILGCVADEDVAQSAAEADLASRKPSRRASARDMENWYVAASNALGLPRIM